MGRSSHECASRYHRAFTGNLGSVRVFEKIGFRRIGDFEDVIQFPESKGGARTGLHVLEWKRNE